MPPHATILSLMLLSIFGSGHAQWETFKLLHSLHDPGTNAQAEAGEGYAVAVEGDIAVVGAPYDDDDYDDSGVVNVCHIPTVVRPANRYLGGPAVLPLEGTPTSDAKVARPRRSAVLLLFFVVNENPSRLSG